MKRLIVLVALFFSCAPYLTGYWKGQDDVMGIDRHEWRVEGWESDTALLNVRYRIRGDLIYIKEEADGNWYPIAKYTMNGSDTLAIQWMNDPIVMEDLTNPTYLFDTTLADSSNFFEYVRFSQESVKAGERAFRERERHERRRDRLFKRSQVMAE